MRPRTRSLNPPRPVPNFGRKGHLWEDKTHSRLVQLNVQLELFLTLMLATKVSTSYIECTEHSL